MKGTSFQSTGLVVIAFPAGMNSIQASGVQDYAGTKGLSKKLEAFSIAPCEIPEVELEYMGHLQDSGDTHWMKAGKLVGIPSSNKRLEGIAVRLKGPAADQYDVKYYVHIQNIGDSVLAANGEFVGTRGKSLSIEGLSVWIEPRVIAPVASSITVRSSGTPLLDVFAYLQGIGPINVYGPHLAGTRGQSRAMEAFQIRMSEYIPGVELEYMAHIQDTGDTQWHKNGQLIGEYRSGKRIEGFAVRLVGEAAEIFNVKYYGHMQDYGDSHIASNGAFVGTRGERRRLEGLCVWLEHK